MSTIVASGIAAGAAQAQAPVNPFSYSCGTYLAAQQGEDRSQANAMLFWATGYLQARLARLPTTNFTADSFGNDLRDVHAALLRICPNVPEMTLAAFMNNLAGDFEKSAKPKP